MSLRPTTKITCTRWLKRPCKPLFRLLLFGRWRSSFAPLELSSSPFFLTFETTRNISFTRCKRPSVSEKCCLESKSRSHGLEPAGAKKDGHKWPADARNRTEIAAATTRSTSRYTTSATSYSYSQLRAPECYNQRRNNQSRKSTSWLSVKVELEGPVEQLQLWTQATLDSETQRTPVVTLKTHADSSLNGGVKKKRMKRSEKKKLMVTFMINWRRTSLPAALSHSPLAESTFLFLFALSFSFFISLSLSLSLTSSPLSSPVNLLTYLQPLKRQLESNIHFLSLEC